MNRIRVIPFETTFTDAAPDNIEEQIAQKRFPKDPHFAEKLEGLTKAFAWVLLNHRKHLKKRIEPEKVLMATANYKRKNDIYNNLSKKLSSMTPPLKFLSLKFIVNSKNGLKTPCQVILYPLKMK